ncbi:MAG: hypothetical protein AAB502_05510 [Chloroflexota bacterium]
MFNSNAKREKDAYLKNGKWKCAKSGTGSHHWKSDVQGSLTLLCVHCKDHRVFSLDIARSNLGWQSRKKSSSAPATG